MSGFSCERTASSVLESRALSSEFNLKTDSKSRSHVMNQCVVAFPEIEVNTNI